MSQTEVIAWADASVQTEAKKNHAHGYTSVDRGVSADAHSNLIEMSFNSDSQRLV